MHVLGYSLDLAEIQSVDVVGRWRRRRRGRSGPSSPAVAVVWPVYGRVDCDLGGGSCAGRVSAELVESLGGDGGHRSPHRRVVSQDGVEVLYRQRVEVAVSLRLDAGRPPVIGQQTDLCTAFAQQMTDQCCADDRTIVDGHVAKYGPNIAALLMTKTVKSYRGVLGAKTLPPQK